MAIRKALPAKDGENHADAARQGSRDAGKLDQKVHDLDRDRQTGRQRRDWSTAVHTQPRLNERVKQSKLLEGLSSKMMPHEATGRKVRVRSWA